MIKDCATCRQYQIKNGVYRCACIFNEKGTPEPSDFCAYYEIVAEAERDRLNNEWQAKVCRSEDGEEESNG